MGEDESHQLFLKLNPRVANSNQVKPPPLINPALCIQIPCASMCILLATSTVTVYMHCCVSLQSAKLKQARVRKKEGMVPILKSFQSHSPGDELHTNGEIELESKESYSRYLAKIPLALCPEENQKNQERKRKKKEKTNKWKTKTSTQRGGQQVLDSTNDSRVRDDKKIASPNHGYQENGFQENESDSSEVKLKPSHYCVSSNSLSVASAPFPIGQPPEDASQNLPPELQQLTFSTSSYQTRPCDHTSRLLSVVKGSAPVIVASPCQTGLPVPKTDLPVLDNSNPPHFIVPPEHLLPQHITSCSSVIPCSSVVNEGSSLTPPHLLRPPEAPEQPSASLDACSVTKSESEQDKNEPIELGSEQDEERPLFSHPIQVDPTSQPEVQSVIILNTSYILIHIGSIAIYALRTCPVFHWFLCSLLCVTGRHNRRVARKQIPRSTLLSTHHPVGAMLRPLCLFLMQRVSYQCVMIVTPVLVK